MPDTAEYGAGSEASHMPNKTIYVADSDLPTFERAQELAGENLSATIAGALRRYVQAEEARQRGFHEISLKVGSRKNYSVKRFMGRELARRRERDEALGRVITQTAYQTAKGRFAVYTREAPDWSDWSDWSGFMNVLGGVWDMNVDVEFEDGNVRMRKGGPGPRGDRDRSAWSNDDERRLDIYETFEELKAKEFEDLAASVARALHGEEDEFLDI